MTMPMTQMGIAPMSPPPGGHRFFLGSPAHSDHLLAYGPLTLPTDAAAFIDELDASGLTGRGGAGFPAWRKIAATRSVSNGRRRRPVIIGNGAEGEPMSGKDAVLLRRSPHLVIDGLLVAAAAVSASKMYLYTTAENAPVVQAAIGERADAARIHVVEAPHTFVSGEASAVVNAIGNGAALPQDHVRRMSEAGLAGRPTLLQNVETLAQMALIARFGARWYRAAGTDRDPGTRLVTVTGDVAESAVFEVAGDTPLESILAAAGTPVGSVKAVLVGGYHGVWVPGHALHTPLSAAGLAPFGGQPGAGILVVLGTARCGLRAAAEIVEYLAGQSARQCGPCQFGLPAVGGLLGRLASGLADHTLPAELTRLSDSVIGRGACHHPDGTARLVFSTLSVFADDVQQHLAGRCESTGSRHAWSAA